MRNSSRQLDEDSLPPYPVLDAIIEGVVEYGFSAAKLSRDLEVDSAEVERIVRLIHQNEYKRKQAPPVLKVTTKAFGVGRRMPIVMRHLRELNPSGHRALRSIFPAVSPKRDCDPD